MFYIKENEKIVLFDEDKGKLEQTLEFMPQYKDCEIKETGENETIVDYKLITLDEEQELKLEQLKSDRIAENDRLRDEKLNGGVEYSGVLFDSDTDQKVNLLATYSAMSDEDTIVWYGMDNQGLLCTKFDLLKIGSLITELHGFCWNMNAYIKEQISEVETTEELETIEISYTRDSSGATTDEGAMHVDKNDGIDEEVN